MTSPKSACNVATLIERYFTERLMREREVSANTIASYRDTFRLLFLFAQARLRKSPSALTLTDLSGQSPEDAMNVLVQQTASLLGNEEG